MIESHLFARYLAYDGTCYRRQLLINKKNKVLGRPDTVICFLSRKL